MRSLVSSCPQSLAGGFFTDAAGRPQPSFRVVGFCVPAIHGDGSNNLDIDVRPVVRVRFYPDAEG